MKTVWTILVVATFMVTGVTGLTLLVTTGPSEVASGLLMVATMAFGALTMMTFVWRNP